MKPTTGITLPASFVVTVSHAGAEILPTPSVENDILPVAEVAELLKCKPSSVYNLTRIRTRERYEKSNSCLAATDGVEIQAVIGSRMVESAGNDAGGVTANENCKAIGVFKIPAQVSRTQILTISG